MIKILLMASGAEVIADVSEVVNEGKKVYVAKKPMLIRAQQNGPESYVLMLVPYCISNPEGTLTIHSHAIAAECDAPSDTEQAYIQQTTSIQIASSL